MNISMTPAELQVALARGMSEKELQEHVVKLAEALGWRVWHDQATNHRRVCRHCGRPTAGPRNVAGMPDLLLIRERLVWAELKTESGTASAAQTATHALLRRAGAECHVWRPSDLASIQEILA